MGLGWPGLAYTNFSHVSFKKKKPHVSISQTISALLSSSNGLDCGLHCTRRTNCINIFFSDEIFEGRMKDSEFHGVGKFKWPCGSFMETLFVEGALANYDTYRYADGKLYTTSYCEMPDRR